MAIWLGPEREARSRRGDAVQALGDGAGVAVEERVEPCGDAAEVLGPAVARSASVDDVERDIRRRRHRPVDVHDGGGDVLGAQQLAVEQELDADVRARERAAARHSGGGEVVEQVVLEIEEPALAVEDRIGVVVELHAGTHGPTRGPFGADRGAATEPETRHRREVRERGAEQELGVGARAVDRRRRSRCARRSSRRGSDGHCRDDGGQHGAELLAHDRARPPRRTASAPR